jgi:hypothetical protein
VQRGVLATVRDNTLGDIVQFQYNPESITRGLTPNIDWGTKEQPARRPVLKDAPGQSISFKAYFDAADAMQTADSSGGIGAQLAVLESLLYPTRETFQKYEANRADGKQIGVMEPPRTILVWGQRRVFPVRLTRLSIVEESFNTALNPIRASVDISVDVVTYAMRTPNDDDYKLFGSYHVGLERLAGTAEQPDSATRSKLAARARAT